MCGLLIEYAGTEERLNNPVSWKCHQQKRVSNRAFGEEILAAAEADDRGYDLKMTLKYILTETTLRPDLFVDTRALFDTINNVP